MSMMPIGTLAKAADVKVTTIRFYEEIGLLPQPLRTHSDRRIYGEASIQRLAFIKHARQLGFSVDAIRDLLNLSDHPEKTCADADSIARQQLADIEAKIAQLDALRIELSRMLSEGCSGPTAQCRVIEALSSRALCAHDHEDGERITI